MKYSGEVVRDYRNHSNKPLSSQTYLIHSVMEASQLPANIGLNIDNNGVGTLGWRAEQQWMVRQTTRSEGRICTQACVVVVVLVLPLECTTSIFPKSVF